MSTGTVDLDTKRGRLRAKALPAVIQSDDENDRMWAIIEGLIWSRFLTRLRHAGAVVCPRRRTRAAASVMHRCGYGTLAIRVY